MTFFTLRELAKCPQPIVVFYIIQHHHHSHKNEKQPIDNEKGTFTYKQRNIYRIKATKKPIRITYEFFS